MRQRILTATLNALTSSCTESPSIRILGKNQFDKKNYLNTDYHSEDYVGISPNDDNEFDFLRVSVAPQRTMADCNIRIENSSGEIVKRTENPNAGFDKFMKNQEDFNMDGLPDGNYTVYVTGHLAYEGAMNEEISMKFYIDTVAPEITKKEIREDKDEEGNSKTYLDVSMSDNRYVMGIVAEGKNTDGTDFKNEMYTKAGKESKCSIDITGADISTLKITALDYAYNKTECNVIDETTPSPSATPTISPTTEPTPVPSVTPTGITVTMPNEPFFGSNATAMMFSISNNTNAEVTTDIIAAMYDENDVLKAIAINRDEMLAQGTSSQVFSFKGNLSGKTVKIMIFDSLENMIPLGYGEDFDI